MGLSSGLTRLGEALRNNTSGLSPIQVPSAGSPAEVSHTAPNDVNRVPEAPNGRLGTPGHVPAASEPTLGSALHTASSILRTPKTTCNSWTEIKAANKSRESIKDPVGSEVCLEGG